MAFRTNCRCSSPVPFFDDITRMGTWWFQEKPRWSGSLRQIPQASRYTAQSMTVRTIWRTQPVVLEVLETAGAHAA